MRCPYCGKDLENDSVFCIHCGKKISVMQEQPMQPSGINCPSCGTKNETGSLFCVGCGSSLTGNPQSLKPQKGNTEKNSNKIVIVVIVVLAAVLALTAVGVGGYILFDSISQDDTEQDDDETKSKKNRGKKEEEEEPVPTPTITPAVVITPTPVTEIEIPQQEVVIPETQTQQIPSEYIIPDSSVRRLTSADLNGLNAQQLNYARNEIFARHGRMFNSQELQNYFNSKSWYRGIYTPEYFDEYDPYPLSDIEKANAQLLKEHETALGGYQVR